jgi:hypothetical protein
MFVDVIILKGTGSFVLSFRLLLPRFTLARSAKMDEVGQWSEVYPGPPIKTLSVTSVASVR